MGGSPFQALEIAQMASKSKVSPRVSDSLPFPDPALDDDDRLLDDDYWLLDDKMRIILHITH